MRMGRQNDKRSSSKPGRVQAVQPRPRPAEPGGGEDDEEDHDNVLMDNVADLCGAVAKVGGGLLGEGPADGIFQAFSKYAQPSRPKSDRAMALGCYAEMCVELPCALAAGRHFESLFPLFATACADSHAPVTRNAAFGLGALVEAAPHLGAPRVAEALHALFPMIARADAAPPERAAADRASADNALAAMCRITRAATDAAPVDQVLALVLPRLPLTEDEGENKTCIELLVALAAKNHPSLANHVAPLKLALTGVLAGDKCDDETVTAQATQLLAQLG